MELSDLKLLQHRANFANFLTITHTPLELIQHTQYYSVSVDIYRLYLLTEIDTALLESSYGSLEIGKTQRIRGGVGMSVLCLCRRRGD